MTTQFVLYRENWKRLPWPPERPWQRNPGRTALQSFDTFDAAEAERQRREAIARAQFNPFQHVRGLAEVTFFGEPQLRDWLLDHDIAPPTASSLAAWQTWWTEYERSWSESQRAAAWEALNKMRFYTVVEQPRRPVLYVILENHWNYNDETYYSEGRTPHRAYRTRERAEQVLAELNANPPFVGDDEFEATDWAPVDEFLTGPRPQPEWLPQAEVPTFEIVEMELTEDMA